MKKGNGMGLPKPVFGHSSSAISDKLSRKPPPWSMIPSPINLHSHHWSTVFSHLYIIYAQVRQSQIRKKLDREKESDMHLPKAVRSTQVVEYLHEYGILVVGIESGSTAVRKRERSIDVDERQEAVGGWYVGQYALEQHEAPRGQNEQLLDRLYHALKVVAVVPRGQHRVHANVE